MAWSDAVLTAVGRDLNSKALAGQLRLNFTEIWVGDGTLRNVESATDLAHKRMKADILAIEKDDENGTCKVRFQVSNERLTGSSIVIREIGFYMQNERGQTVLFSAVTNDEPQTLPLMGNNGPTRLKHVMAFGYSNAANITMRPSIMEGQNADQVKAAIDNHNRDTSSHKAIFDTFVKSVTGNNDTITVRNGAGQSSNITVNNVRNSKRLQADELGSGNRLNNINQPSTGDSTLRYFLATGGMPNRPGGKIDGAVLQCGWDWNNGFDSQLLIPNSTAYRLRHRAQNGSADWSSASDWKELAWKDDVDTKLDSTNGIVSGRLYFGNASNAKSSIRLHDNGTFEVGDNATNNLFLLSSNRPKYYPPTGGSQELAVRNDLNAYLPLSGGTMTGTLTMNGAGQTIKNGNKSANITVSPSGVLDIGGTATENINLYTNNRPSWYKQNNGGAKALALLEELTSMDTALKALIAGINLEQLAKSTGVKYDFSNENAWYIHLGKAFGGLIIQGGYLRGVSQASAVRFPLKYSSKCLAVVANDIAGNNYTAKALTTNNYTEESFKIWGTKARDGDDLIYGRYVSVGY